jgi:cell division protein FtsW (lipid II flippase)
MEQLTKLGRILYAIPFGVFGIVHFIYPDKIGRDVPNFIFGRTLWAYITGLALIAACVSISSRILIKLSTVLLSILLLLFILTIHIPGMGNAATFDAALNALLKDSALLGAALFIAGYYAEQEKPKGLE